MFITDIKYYRYGTPLKKPFKTSLRTVEVIESIYVFIETNVDGFVGVGEAVPTYVITGDTKGGIEAAIEEVFKPLLINKPLSKDLLQEIHEIIVGNTSAKAAIDMALYDLLAQDAELPLYKYLNHNPGNKSLETCYTVSLNEADEMVADALRYVREGYNHLKIKVGKDNVETDLNRLKALRNALPTKVILSADANQAWDEESAHYALKHFDEANLNIESIEQPVNRYEYSLLGELARGYHIPVMADESLFSPYDANQLIETGADKLWNIKLMKSGGIFQALKIHAIAKSHNVSCMVGCMMETHVSVTAALHFSLAADQVERVDFDAPLMVLQREVQGGIQYDKAKVFLSEGNGLGIDRAYLYKKVSS
ncbi:dipeptide epimerase [Mammaliicoccus stepanovicii]|uniref:Dipeptide epimerase n=1 Tax=Mammaliicoccus stepanovicii TaxID=643214 RepID=A0A240AD05_9STAP|nr:dipeptide epimerase [Mammaliicoccus stepanovicii]PNZ77824.1 dipeptide epimerase [Mammaliicoccus stepanovicii]GGI43174.1 L-Ala-D/L-Glu epimerase [Mammaliicoccus stepanovicii]SNV81150.1 gluconate dehydratase [Mammaliicoccus stepanovicii]